MDILIITHIYQLSKKAYNLKLKGRKKRLELLRLLVGANETLTLCTFKMKRKELAWSPAQTACINKACRRECDVRVRFDRFVSGEIPSVWCRFSDIVTLEGHSHGIDLHMFSLESVSFFSLSANVLVELVNSTEVCRSETEWMNLWLKDKRD